jgi:ER lumen protein retaining receptor
MLWVFSEILESVCVVPQLLLLRQTTVPTVLDSFYLVTLGTYRFMYVLNWIVRGINEPGYADPTSWVWGSIQTGLMIDFAWVYWTRQRVKLRRGGVVDSEDLGRGWLVGRIVGQKNVDFDFDEEATAPRNDEAQNTNKWGRRGISVSADEGVEGAPRRQSPTNGTADPERQPLADPAAFEDESDDDAPPPVAAGSSVNDHGVRADEWADDLDDDAKPHDGTAK